MSRQCNTHGRNVKFVQNFGQSLNGRNHFKDLDVDGPPARYLIAPPLYTNIPYSVLHKVWLLRLLHKTLFSIPLFYMLIHNKEVITVLRALLMSFLNSL
jgi:hypothetical protein